VGFHSWQNWKSTLSTVPISDKSKFTEPSPERPLRSEESLLIRTLLLGIYSDEGLDKALNPSRVVNLQDGGMGSIRFARSEPRSFGRTLVEAEYLDADGVLVSLTVNQDDQDQLFELDFWKVDFSPLRRYPSPADVRIKNSGRVAHPFDHRE
jgi:hypothetical protein